MQNDVVHCPRPDEQRIRRARSALVTVSTAFDDQTQIVIASETDGRDDVVSPGGRDRIDARRGHPRIHPAGVLRQSGLVTEVIGILQSLENFLARCAVRLLLTRSQRRLHLDQTSLDGLPQLVPVRLGGPRRVAGADASSRRTRGCAFGRTRQRPCGRNGEQGDRCGAFQEASSIHPGRLCFQPQRAKSFQGAPQQWSEEPRTQPVDTPGHGC